MEALQDFAEKETRHFLEMRESDCEHLWGLIFIFYCCLNPRSHEQWPVCVWCLCVSECLCKCEGGWRRRGRSCCLWSSPGIFVLRMGFRVKNICWAPAMPQALWGAYPPILSFGFLCNSVKWEICSPLYRWGNWGSQNWMGCTACLTSTIDPSLYSNVAMLPHLPSALGFQSLRHRLALCFPSASDPVPGTS